MARAKFQGGPLASLLPLGGGRVELWALSLARQKLKGSVFAGGTWWLLSSSSCSCWKPGFLGTSFTDDLLSGFVKPHST